MKLHAILDLCGFQIAVARRSLSQYPIVTITEKNCTSKVMDGMIIYQVYCNASRWCACSLMLLMRLQPSYCTLRHFSRSSSASEKWPCFAVLTQVTLSDIEVKIPYTWQLSTSSNPVPSCDHQCDNIYSESQWLPSIFQKNWRHLGNINFTFNKFQPVTLLCHNSLAKAYSPFCICWGRRCCSCYNFVCVVTFRGQ